MGATTELTAELWTRLRDVSALQFKAASRSDAGWDGVGTGIVKVSEPSPGVLIYEESGHWQNAAGREIRFNNVFRWSQCEDHLRLEHLRFGPNRPVFLFEMAPDGDGAWHDLAPHLCRQDHYTATLLIEDERLFLNWSVHGPRHNESIAYVYV